jgi:hypothetical protein
VTVVNGSNVAIVSGGLYFDSVLINLGASPISPYRVVGGAGTTLVLDRPVTEPTGVYSVFQALATTWLDSSSFLRNVSSNFIGQRPLFKEGVLNGYPATYMTRAAFYNVLPIMHGSNMTNLQYIAVTRQNASDSQYVLFSHSSGLLNSNAFFEVTVDNRSRAGILTPVPNFVSVQTAPALAPPSFNMNYASILSVGSTRQLQVSTNGSLTPNTTASATNAACNSTVQRIGNRNNGITDSDGFAGDIVEMVFVSGLTVADRQRLEGYLAWKYNLVSNLPLAHPYKTVRP